MSIHANYSPPNIADIRAAVDHILAMPRDHKRDPRDDFEPTAEDYSDFGHDGADRAEARETAWREG